MNPSYDALLVVSFGGPEGRDDVIPFLTNVLRGRDVPEERLQEVAEHYYHFDGISPINGQNRKLIAALEEDLREHQIQLPIYFGNRNWHPFLEDTLRKMRDDGVQRAMAFFTSAFSSYSGCRQYRENIEQARERLGMGAPEVDKLRHYYNHPGFIATMVDRVKDALGKLGGNPRDEIHVALTAHSLPLSMARQSAYTTQLQEASRLVAEAVEVDDWALVFQSRSGPPDQPWLEPDICDHLRQLADAERRKKVVICPIGFISDHMEVMFDLDVEARNVADELELQMVRAGTAGTHGCFISMIRELVQERMQSATDRPALGVLGPSPDVCAPGCCLRS